MNLKQRWEWLDVCGKGLAGHTFRNTGKNRTQLRVLAPMVAPLLRWAAALPAAAIPTAPSRFAAELQIFHAVAPPGALPAVTLIDVALLGATPLAAALLAAILRNLAAALLAAPLMAATLPAAALLALPAAALLAAAHPAADSCRTKIGMAEWFGRIGYVWNKDGNA